MYAVCVCPTDNEVKSCVDIGDGSSVRIQDQFCYLGDMLPMNGDGDVVVTARIRSGWFKFRSLTSSVTAKDVSLLQRGKAYDSCTSYILHGSKTWSLKKRK